LKKNWGKLGKFKKFSGGILLKLGEFPPIGGDLETLI
jgi:hypothetical protein